MLFILIELSITDLFKQIKKKINILNKIKSPATHRQGLFVEVSKVLLD